MIRGGPEQLDCSPTGSRVHFCGLLLILSRGLQVSGDSLPKSREGIVLHVKALFEGKCLSSDRRSHRPRISLQTLISTVAPLITPSSVEGSARRPLRPSGPMLVSTHRAFTSPVRVMPVELCARSTLYQCPCHLKRHTATDRACLHPWQQYSSTGRVSSTPLRTLLQPPLEMIAAPALSLGCLLVATWF